MDLVEDPPVVSLLRLSTSGSGWSSGLILERGCRTIDFDFGFGMDPV